MKKALTIAGSDSGGGAGIQADLKTFMAFGVYGMSAITALTAQNTVGVQGVVDISPDFVREQIRSVMTDIGTDAAKTGMLSNAAIVKAVAESVREFRIPNLVVDPVMIAKSGDALLGKNDIGVLREALIPRESILTPNLPEAGALLGERAPETVKEMSRAAERLRKLLRDDGERWVLLKGGHLPGDEALDLLFNGDRMIELAGAKVATKNSHGTGCTLSAALAALIPQQMDVPAAARRAKEYVGAALAHAHRLSVGTGNGPVHHFYGWWS
jgi:hydroxymethylpyrimidine/phosphomethylpyrimidine kinase